MSSARDFDALAMAVDLIRQDECQQLFNAIYEEDERVTARALEEGADPRDGYLKGYYKDGLRFAMDVLDARIGHLRDRWG